MNNKKAIFCPKKTHNMARFMEICLLLLLSQESSYGYTLSEKLSNFGFTQEELNIGSLYRTLRKMEKDKYVTSIWQEGGPGPKKRVYQITRKGENILDQWIDILKYRKKRINRLINNYEKIVKSKNSKENK